MRTILRTACAFALIASAAAQAACHDEWTTSWGGAVSGADFCSAVLTLFNEGATLSACSVDGLNASFVQQFEGVDYPFTASRECLPPDDEDAEPGFDPNNTAHLLQALIVMGHVFLLWTGFRAGDKV